MSADRKTLSQRGSDRRTNRKRLRRRERGMSSIEVAILFPAAVFLVLMAFQAAIYWHAKNVVSTAADQAVNAGKVVDGGGVGEAMSAAQNVLDNGGGALSGVTVNASVSGENFQVLITATVPRLMGIGPEQVTALSEAPLEEFRNATER